MMPNEMFQEPAARASDPETSHEAAALAKFKASPHRILCLQALMRGPMTDFELATVTGLQQTSIGKRRLDCQRAGLVSHYLEPVVSGLREPLPLKRKSPSGALAFVWEITPAGREYLEGLA